MISGRPLSPLSAPTRKLASGRFELRVRAGGQLASGMAVGGGVRYGTPLARNSGCRRAWCGVVGFEKQRMVWFLSKVCFRSNRNTSITVGGPAG
jgi:hypothetical protein